MKTDSLFTFLGGVLVGAAVAILFAPDSGEETRKKIKNTFDKEYQGLKDRLGNFCKPETETEGEPQE
ncbi:MAG TPA: YtxH domain-containing protein [Candidatus Coprenecus pullistercoris]|nr:YtxH domain-containing protein [Candidatus Coprenecus pullistercoris]